MEQESQKEFLQECMFDALMKLMDQFPLEEISITQLCQEAGVSRMTYYRNYHAKEDILKVHMDRVFSEYYAGLAARKGLTLYDYCVAFFQMFLGSERAFVRRVQEIDLGVMIMDQFYNYLYDILALAGVSNEKSPYLRSFLAGGLYKLAVDWFRSGAEETPEEMATLMTQFFRQ